MKRYLATYLVLFLICSACPLLKAQDLLADAAGERIQVCTDRTLYVSGEKVFFSAIIYNTKHLFAEEFSRVFYCELIRPDGTRVTGGKYLLHKTSGHGCITIPEETISGIYFLKFYTRFMRNASQDDYKYILVKIINPVKTEVLPGNDKENTNPATGKPDNEKYDSSLKIATGKINFSPREKIRIDIKVNSGTGIPPKLCLSVIPESTDLTPFSPVWDKTTQTGNAGYYPETRGISLTGQLISKVTGKPVTDANVNLSIIGDKDILVGRTDLSGRFFFALPDYHGNRDIFLSSDELPALNPEIQIDNDFCSRPVHLPSPLFTLNEEESKAAYKLAVNSKVAALFRENTITGDTAEEEVTTSFYGKPSEVLIMDKYIELPTLGEYFTELPGMLKLRKIQGKRHFRFYTEEEEMSMYDPLVLIDWVAIEDIEKILAMSPQKIDRVELVNAPYIKGSITYGGIVSFVSKKKDFAGINLPTSGTFVNYGFLEDCDDNPPEYKPSVNIPDARNTLYWDPDLNIDKDGSATISITAPDTPGNYIILLKKITVNGEESSTREVIVVK